MKINPLYRREELRSSAKAALKAVESAIESFDMNRPDLTPGEFQASDSLRAAKQKIRDALDLLQTE